MDCIHRSFQLFWFECWFLYVCLTLQLCLKCLFVWDFVYRNCAELSVFDQIVWSYTCSPFQKAWNFKHTVLYMYCTWCVDLQRYKVTSCEVDFTYLVWPCGGIFCDWKEVWNKLKVSLPVKTNYSPVENLTETTVSGLWWNKSNDLLFVYEHFC